jgi:uncharacterized membrane protein
MSNANDAMNSTGRIGSRSIIAVAIVALFAGIFFRVFHLDRKTLWGDEIVGLVRMLGYTEAEIVSAGPHVRTAADVQAYFNLAGPANDGPRPLATTISSLASEDPQHPPLYYLMGRLWAAWAGVTPAALRTLPVLFGILSICGMAWLAFELFGSARPALLAAAVYAVSPFAVLYSQEAREYSLWAFETLASSALLLRAIRTQGTGRWLAYGASVAVSLYTYPLTIFVLMSHAVFVAVSPPLRKRTVLIPYLATSIVATLLFLPWLAILATSGAGAMAMGTLLSNKPTLLGIGLTFMRDLKQTWADVGSAHGLTRLVLSTVSSAILAAVLYALFRLLRSARRDANARFILALFAVPAIPLFFFHGGALVGQVRYFEPTYLAIALALAAWYQAAFEAEHPPAAVQFACASTCVLIMAVSTLSCLISARSDTWYNKAYERTPEVAMIVNAADRPLVVGDRDQTLVRDRGTARVLELGYYLRPEIPMRVNLHCDACLIAAPAPIDVFADAAQFHDVFVLGHPKRSIPDGSYVVRRIGIDIDPDEQGPLEMFAAYPR